MRSGLLPSYPPRFVGMAGGAYGGIGAGYGAAGFPQVRCVPTCGDFLVSLQCQVNIEFNLHFCSWNSLFIPSNKLLMDHHYLALNGFQL